MEEHVRKLLLSAVVVLIESGSPLQVRCHEGETCMRVREQERRGREREFREVESEREEGREREKVRVGGNGS